MQPSAPRRRVVVGVDGSPSSCAAVRWAAEYARLVGGVMEAIHAWDTPSAIGWTGPAIDPEFDLEQARERFAEGLRVSSATTGRRIWSSTWSRAIRRRC